MSNDYINGLEKEIEWLKEKLRKPEKAWCYWEEKPRDSQGYTIFYFIGNRMAAAISLPNPLISNRMYIRYEVCGVTYNLNRSSSIAEVKEIIENEFWGTGVKKYNYV